MWCLCLLLIIFIAYLSIHNEGFATKQDKAAAISQWFASNPEPTYTAYKQDVPNPSIVEYEDALQLKQKNKLSVDELVKKL